MGIYTTQRVTREYAIERILEIIKHIKNKDYRKLDFTQTV